MQTNEMATEKMKVKYHARVILVNEELGMNTEELSGSAMEAAGYFFILFLLGPLWRVLPFLFLMA